MSKPKLLDLFCGGGGAGMGYSRAGFEVVGVDIRPQPHYPFEFIQADALTFPLEGFDAIHASPPCQAFSKFAKLRPEKVHPDLLTPMRKRLLAQSAPWVIENVPGAPMRADIVLCGSMFRLGVDRDRWFELSWPWFDLMPAHVHDGDAVCVVGHGGGSGKGTKVKGWRKAEGAAAMGIDWMTRDELTQAIPPAFTHFVGTRLMQSIHQGAEIG